MSGSRTWPGQDLRQTDVAGVTMNATTARSPVTNYMASGDINSTLELAHSQRLLSVFQTGLGSDVTFLLGPAKEEVKAHQFVLKTHSPVFQEMLLGAKPQNGILIEDADAIGFRKFIQFLYTGQFPKNKTDANMLVTYAIIFKVLDLVEWCCRVIGESINTESVVTIYEEAVTLNLNQLRDRAYEYILTNAHIILDSEQVLKFTNHNFFKILSSDSLAAKNEMQVFQAVLRWGKEQCKLTGIHPTGNALRNVLSDLLPLIRFPVIDKSDFSLFVSTSEILTEKELISVLLYFNVEDSKRSSMPPGTFNPVERTWFAKIPMSLQNKPTTEEYIIHRLSPYQAQLSADLSDFLNHTHLYSLSHPHQRGQLAQLNYSRQKFYELSRQSVISNGYVQLKHGNVQQIKFQVNHPIWITSVGINGRAIGVGLQQHKESKAGSISLVLMESSTGETITALKWNSIHTLGSQTLQLNFQRDVRIQPNVYYTIKMTYGEKYFTVTGFAKYADSHYAYAPYYASLYCAPPGDNGKEKTLHVPEHNKSITMEFAEVEPRVDPCYTGLTQGFIPTIGFKLD